VKNSNEKNGDQIWYEKNEDEIVKEINLKTYFKQNK